MAAAMNATDNDKKECISVADGGFGCGGGGRRAC